MTINTKRLFFQTHEQIEFKFIQNKYDFIVDEVPLGSFSNSGNFLILRIKKEFLSTWDLLTHISKVLNIDEHKIGYAGLKDKNATTTQYISIPLTKEKFLKNINNKSIKLLSANRHNKKLNIGDLKGNKFRINLKEVEEKDLPLIYQALSQIQKNGMMNYFGYQRFGKDYDFQRAKNIVYGEEIIKNKKLEHFMISAYQSYYFNAWLAKRVELCKDKGFNKLQNINGDILNLFDKKTITGLLPGRKIIRASKNARDIEKDFDDEYIHAKGFRRDSIVKIKNITSKFVKTENKLILKFELPKSSYATVLIESIANRNFK